ncbi:MAG TPA: 2-aminoethylphosphonate--pyruvate transaminase [Lachnospiraceae bacterium]|nr:2-aminoethylphosphonate--pyruvate transaminase [Lachnospiraceae bacterium]MBQ9568434.1 2-aminoethylphosphonate--pyruvate transaminase [Lachnospiraceae bacterium]MCR4786172.1 2-aminoethylphosphonate--pyruvate transaminase [Lachnospiraceae bacterium]HCR99600.1 2-aminoethylphosphonate--pyruvate transaminase [Lachnospiraceae bacterium]
MKTTERKILLNPGPSTTTDTVKNAQVVPDICPREKEFGKIMSDLAKDLVSIVHGGEEYAAVLFCGSGTICIDITLNSLLDRDKKALVVQNGSYSERACEVLKAYGMPFIQLDQPIDRVPDLSAIEKVMKENDDIGYVYMTHHETGTGLLNPIREVGEIAHRYGAFFITDTTSSYAMIPIDVHRDNVDFCMASAQKGIMGMTGLSYVIGRKDLIERSKDYPMRSYYCNLYLQYHYFETTGQMHFTPPVQTIYAAKQALIEYFDEGEEKKWERHRRVMAAIHKGEDELGLKEMLNRDVQSGLVSAIRYPDDPSWDFDKIHDYCYERGFTIYPGKIEKKGTFRLCALGAIDDEDIRDFWKVFREGLVHYGVEIPVRYNG